MIRVEQHVIKPKSEYYAMLLDFCHLSKNLYNHANFVARQEFIKNNKWLRYNELNNLCKSDLDYPDYKSMPTAQCAQQTLKLLDKSWSSFFKSIKDYKNNKSKYLGKPNLPKYLSKDGYLILTLTNQNCKLIDGYIKFPKCFNDFKIKTKIGSCSKLQQVRIVPKLNYLIVEVVYKIDKEVKPRLDNKRYLSIDLGISNFAAITNNFGLKPIIVNGNGLKSINKYYNKQLAKYKSLAKTVNKLDTTKRIQRLHSKRHFKMHDAMHKISSYIIKYANENDVSKIVIGYNKSWKNKSNLNKVVNQTFVQIPYLSFIEKLKYKAESLGIELIIVNEAYTSGTSFFDNELATAEYYNKDRRVYRGLFKTNTGVLVNADINASLQILKQVSSDAFKECQEVQGLVLNPVKINLI